MEQAEGARPESRPYRKFATHREVSKVNFGRAVAAVMSAPPRSSEADVRASHKHARVRTRPEWRVPRATVTILARLAWPVLSRVGAVDQ